LASPFWEAICYTLIFGLLSSTALVILVFPYYYLGAEYLRLRIRRRSFFRWLLFNGLLAAIVTAIYSTPAALQVIAGLNLLLILRQLLKARKRSK
jgi:pheromone shutdown protein TraB